MEEGEIFQLLLLEIYFIEVWLIYNGVLIFAI